MLPSGIQEWQIVDCQNSQGTAVFRQNKVERFGCAVRGFKIVLLLTLASIEIDHVGVDVCFCHADGLHQWWKVLVNMRDGQRLAVQRPPLHRHHKHDRIHQAALVEIEKLVDRVRNLNVGNLYVRKWRCKFLLMVLQYRRLCLSRRIAESVHFVFKFCLYIVYHV